MLYEKNRFYVTFRVIKGFTKALVLGIYIKWHIKKEKQKERIEAPRLKIFILY